MQFKTKLLMTIILGVAVVIWMGIAITTTRDTSPLTKTEVSQQVLSFAEVQSHNSQTSCWTIIEGNVYDITNYVNLHPGGKQTIMRACGVDATTLFNSKGGGKGHSQNAKTILEKYSMGALGSTTANTSITVPVAESKELDDLLDWDDDFEDEEDEEDEDVTTITIPPSTTPTQTIPSTSETTPSVTTFSTVDVAAHNSKTSCWVIVSNKAYDVTGYIYLHPGGSGKILRSCGKDITRNFQSESAHKKNNAQGVLEGYYMGDVA